jgi:hypothetical protein
MSDQLISQVAFGALKLAVNQIVKLDEILTAAT